MNDLKRDLGIAVPPRVAGIFVSCLTFIAFLIPVRTSSAIQMKADAQSVKLVGRSVSASSRRLVSMKQISVCWKCATSMSSEKYSGLEEESESRVFLVKEILVQDHFYRKYSTITSFFELDNLPSTPDDEPGATLKRVASIVSRG